jgi:tRNA threonylcarbamoyl adenosine modification protein YeaZ
MSKVLAIDTSTSRSCVAIIEGTNVLYSGFRDGATAHGPSLPALVQEALAVSDVDEVVVGMGPGPFTGLRVGIAFAQTFALARGIPGIGVCSLDAIKVEDSQYTVAIDARRKEIYWASYKDGVRVDGPHVNKPAEVENFIIDVFPDMAKLVALSKTQNLTEPMYLRRPDAVPTAER